MELKQAKLVLTGIAKKIDEMGIEVRSDLLLRLISEGDLNAPVVFSVAETGRLEGITLAGGRAIKKFLIEHLTVEEIADLAAEYLMKMTADSRKLNASVESLSKKTERVKSQYSELRERKIEIRQAEISKLRQASKVSARVFLSAMSRGMVSPRRSW